MKNSIYKKIRTHTLVLGIVTATVFTILIAAGLLGTRKTMVSAGNKLGDSAATDARRLLIEQTENELSRLAQSKAAVSDEKLAATVEYVRIISQIATDIKSNPQRYGRRTISFPDTTNTDGKVTVMVQIPNQTTTYNMLRNEIELMANIQDLLLSIQTNNANVGTTYVGTEYGVTVCADPDSAQKTPYFDPRTRPWYINAKQANGLIWTDVFEDYLGRGMAITCAQPFYDASGEIAGVAGMGTFLAVLSEEVIGTKIGETGYAFIINQKGEIIISDNIEKDEDGKIIRENILEIEAFPRETSLKMINREHGIDHFIMDGKEKLIAFHELSTVPWSLAVIIDAEEVISPALMLENNIISLKQSTLAIFNGDILLIAALAGIILIFTIAGVMYFSGRLAGGITRPIITLTSDATRIGTGDLEHALEVKTGDELEILADSFNSMIAGIKTIATEKERIEIASAEKSREADIIQEANQNLQTILNMLPVGVSIMAREDGSLLFANKALLDVYNCTSAEQIKNGYELMPPIQPDGRKTDDVLVEVFQKESGTVEIQGKKIDGELFIARIHFILTNYKGKRAYLSVIEDTTAEKEYQEKLRNIALQEQEANQLKSRFLATMSHEIRTPMNAIIGIMEMQLQKEDNPPETKEAFERIYESGILLLNIINDILDFSKIAEGKMEIVPFRYDIPSLINDATQLNYLHCESKPINFIVSVDPDTPLELVGDGLRVKQILNNLLSNAFKYTNEGEVELSVFSERSSEAPGEEVIIVFRIRDTGQGIPEGHLNKLFEDYMRFNRDINRTVTGTGLGLSITKRLLNLMNGEIAVESQAGIGSVFTVRLPQKRFGEAVCGAETAQRLREFTFHSTEIAKKTQIVREYMPYGSVLIVDDVKSNLFVARGLLSPYGLQIDTVESGLEAIKKIKDGHVYDVIFMDHMMPVMDGIEATRIIRGTGYDRPIIALTANALVGQAEMFMQQGFDAFIPKPIDSRKLNAVLNEFIRDRKPPEIVEAARQEWFKKNVKGKKDPAEKKEKLSELEKFFLLDAKASVKKLEEICAHRNALDEKDREAYEITVHGMKSALANIGETELSETARGLEHAVIEKNIAVMLEETPAFIDALKSLIEKLGVVKERSDVHITGEDRAYLREKLLEVKKACEMLDKKTAKEAIAALKQRDWSRQIHDVFDDISVQLLHSDFEQAAAKADVAIAENTEK